MLVSHTRKNHIPFFKASLIFFSSLLLCVLFFAIDKGNEQSTKSDKAVKGDVIQSQERASRQPFEIQGVKIYEVGQDDKNEISIMFSRAYVKNKKFKFFNLGLLKVLHVEGLRAKWVNEGKEYTFKAPQMDINLFNGRVEFPGGGELTADGNSQNVTYAMPLKRTGSYIVKTTDGSEIHSKKFGEIVKKLMGG